MVKQFEMTRLTLVKGLTLERQLFEFTLVNLVLFKFIMNVDQRII